MLDFIKKSDFNRCQNEVKGFKHSNYQLKVCKPDPKWKQRKLAMEYDQSIKAGITPSFVYSNEWRTKSEQENLEKLINLRKKTILIIYANNRLITSVRVINNL